MNNLIIYVYTLHIINSFYSFQLFKILLKFQLIKKTKYFVYYNTLKVSKFIYIYTIYLRFELITIVLSVIVYCIYIIRFNIFFIFILYFVTYYFI